MPPTLRGTGRRITHAPRSNTDLVAEHQLVGGYDSVKYFVSMFNASLSLPFRRMECAPGEEAHLDYGRALGSCGWQTTPPSSIARRVFPGCFSSQLVPPKGSGVLRLGMRKSEVRDPKQLILNFKGKSKSLFNW